jgi:hypothetical protein
VAISPASVALLNTQSEQFVATVTGSLDQSVSWSVNGVKGGSPTLGTISTTGFYVAPSATPLSGVVSITATSNADSLASASAKVTISPRLIDFRALPDQLDTNLDTFLVSGSTEPGDVVTVNGVNVSLDASGDFVLLMPLTVGPNRVELDILSGQNGQLSFVRNINRDPAFSTAGRRLLYVASISPGIPGTIVIDVDNSTFLGVIQNKLVRGISPDGGRLYMDNLSVISTATHQVLTPPYSPLNFSASSAKSMA